MTIDCSSFTIRSWQHSDALSLAHHANDKDIWLNLRDRFPYSYTVGDAEEWIKGVAGSEPETNFAIAINGQAVGGIGLLLGEDIARCSAEVGYWLGRTYWGQGIGSEALQIFTTYTLDTFGLCRIIAVPFPGNQASIRLSR